MDLNLLQPFCGIHPYTGKIAVYDNNNIVATDGHIAIITKNIFEINHYEPMFDTLHSYMKPLMESENKQEFDISDIKGLDSIPCDRCNNTGFSSNCPECINGRVEWTSENGYEYEADCEVVGCKRGKIDLTKPINKETEEILDNCPKCEGKLFVYDDVIRPYGHLKFKTSLLLKLTKLNDVKLIIIPDTKYGYFTFDEGYGLICPIN